MHLPAMGRRKQHLVLAVPEKSRRAAGRQRVGKLQDNLVGAVALRKYRLAVGLFLTWLAIMGVADADDWDSLDRQMCGCLEYLWENGESKGYGGDALSGVQHFLMTRRKCPGAWRLLTTWGRLELPSRAPPLPPLVALALAGLALSQGLQDFAAIVLVAFHCFLRIGEAFSITRQALCLDTNFCGIVRLGWTKGGKRRGAEEFTQIEEPCAGQLLLRALSLKGLSDPLLTVTAGAFRLWFDRSCSELGVGSCNFRPYSLRRGGATHHWQLHANMSKTVERGRWSCIRTDIFAGSRCHAA